MTPRRNAIVCLLSLSVACVLVAFSDGCSHVPTHEARIHVTFLPGTEAATQWRCHAEDAGEWLCNDWEGTALMIAQYIHQQEVERCAGQIVDMLGERDGG